MARYLWSVEVGPTFSTVAMTDVQGISITLGQTQLTDELRAGTCTIQGRDPDNQPPIAVGDDIIISADFGSPVTYQYAVVMRVTDYVVEYGIVPEMDTWTLYGEDAFAVLGRATIDDTFTAGWGTQTAAGSVCSASGVLLDAATTGSGASTVSAQTITNGNALQVFSQVFRTEQGQVRANGWDSIIWWSRNNASFATLDGYLSDDGTFDGSSVTAAKYDRIQFAGIADNYADQVLIEPAGLATQTSGSGVYSYTASTYDETTAQAANLAAYVKGTLDINEAVPYQTSVFADSNANNVALTLAQPFQTMGLRFRGSDYWLYVLGCTVTATPEATRVSYNLASSLAFSTLTLDDPVLGRLDYNKLGF